MKVMEYEESRKDIEFYTLKSINNSFMYSMLLYLETRYRCRGD